MKNIEKIVSNILLWYFKHKRDLPWRKTHDPYRILVSEVMLQQTQVDRVISKYQQFLRLFPTVQQLAQAPAREVLKAWQGLGYNRRALYLWQSAKDVVVNHGGRFPRRKEEFLKLPGVGEYTARALLSFAFRQPVLMLDTNHRRFYRQLLFHDKLVDDRTVLEKAENIFLPLLRGRVYHWNQAIMDWMLAQPRDRKRTRKKTEKISFRQTDRYFRGRMIEYLRVRDSLSFRKMQSMFPEVSLARRKKIVTGLVKHGLIQVTKSGIVNI